MDVSSELDRQPATLVEGFGAAPLRKVEAPVALIVLHGLGQPFRFETVECAVEALRRTEVRRRQNAPNVTVRHVKSSEGWLGRAELQLVGQGGSPIDVHVYEVHWAAVSNRAVSRAEMLEFVLQSVRGGLSASLRGRASRPSFGRLQVFPVQHSTLLATLLAILVFGAFWLVDKVALAIAAARTVFQDKFEWPSLGLFVSLAQHVALFYFALVITLAAPVILSRWRASRRDGNPPTALVGLGWFLFWSGLLSMVTFGGWVLFDLIYHAGRILPNDVAATDRFGLLETFSNDPIRTEILLAAGIWLANFWVKRTLGKVCERYIGDLALYFAPDLSAQFSETKEAILAEALRVMRGVYAMRGSESPEPLYPRVILFGHSLGSLIAYDALNHLSAEDRVGLGGVGVDVRTAAFITAGSMLDKEAMFEMTRGPSGTGVRVAMVAADQELMLDYSRRPSRWTNLWSPNDPLGGRLNLFDDQGANAGQKRVENLRDGEAVSPMLAHQEYWSGRLLGDVLHRELTA